MTDDSPRAQARRAWLARVRESVDEDASAPLWRAAQVFRALSLVYAIGYQVSINGQLDRPRTAAVLGVVLLVWSVACAVAYLTGFGRNWKWVGAEIVMTVALLLSTSSVASTTWIDENQPWKPVYLAQPFYNLILAAFFEWGVALHDLDIEAILKGEKSKELMVAEARGMVQLKGHRSVGGMRASIYNAQPMAGVKALVSFMKAFEKKNG